MSKFAVLSARILIRAQGQIPVHWIVEVFAPLQEGLSASEEREQAANAEAAAMAAALGAKCAALEHSAAEAVGVWGVQGSLCFRS